MANFSTITPVIILSDLIFTVMVFSKYLVFFQRSHPFLYSTTYAHGHILDPVIISKYRPSIILAIPLSNHQSYPSSSPLVPWSQQSWYLSVPSIHLSFLSISHPLSILTFILTRFSSIPWSIIIITILHTASVALPFLHFIVFITWTILLRFISPQFCPCTRETECGWEKKKIYICVCVYICIYIYPYIYGYIHIYMRTSLSLMTTHFKWTFVMWTGVLTILT